MLKNKGIYLIPTFGFLFVILIGWLLLMLPISNKGNATFLDDIFVSVSAVCVNGFTTVNISENYTLFGQIIIAVITEIGAIGFVTFISFILNIKKKKMPLSEILLLSSVLNNTDYSKLRKRLYEVIKYTIFIEVIGASLLSVRFIPMFGVKEGLWYSIFHSITAFCNAGFDLFGTKGFTLFSKDIYVNFVVIVLMLLGGIGFFVIEDLIICLKCRSIKNMRFHTKIVIMTTFFLYIASILLIKIVEPKLTILQVLFMGATLRTTGFSTINIANTSNLAKFIFSAIMLIGGAPRFYLWRNKNNKFCSYYINC